MQRFAFLLVWALVLSIPWQNMVFVPGLGTISRGFGLAAVAGAIIAVFAAGSVRRLGPIHVLVASFVAWGWLSLFWTIDPSVTTTRLLTLAQLAAMVFLIWEFSRTEKQQGQLVQAYVLGAWVSAVAVATAYFAAGGELDRASGPNFSANFIATLMALGIPLAWYLLLSKSHRLIMAVNLAYIPAALYAVALTGSRTGMIVAVVGLVCMFLLAHRSRVAAKVSMGAIAAALILGVSTLIPNGPWERVLDTPAQISNADLNGRIWIWQTAYAITEDHSILGVGAGAFPSGVFEATTGDSSAHNSFISVAVELGPVGIGLFIAIIALVFRSVFLTPKPERWIWLALLLMWVLAASTDSNDAHKHTWFVFTLIVSVGARTAWARRHGRVPAAITEPAAGGASL